MLDFEFKQTDETKFLVELHTDVIRIQKAIEDHLKIPILEYPIVLNDNVDNPLHNIMAPCPNCGFPLIDLRGTYQSKFNIIELQLSGYCVECNNVSTPILRWYPDGHWCVKQDGEWQQMVFLEPPTFFERVRIRIKEFFYKFKKS